VPAILAEAIRARVIKMVALESDRRDATLKDIPARDPEKVTPFDQATVDSMQQGMDWFGF
jgi:hypothetical protein